jgi:hypothetical protein
MSTLRKLFGLVLITVSFASCIVAVPGGGYGHHRSHHNYGHGRGHGHGHGYR